MTCRVRVGKPRECEPCHAVMAHLESAGDELPDPDGEGCDDDGFDQPDDGVEVALCFVLVVGVHVAGC